MVQTRQRQHDRPNHPDHHRRPAGDHGSGAPGVAGAPGHRADEPKGRMERADALGRSRVAGAVDERGRIRCAVRATAAVRRTRVLDRRGIRRAPRRRAPPRRPRSGAGRCALRQSGRAECADSALAGIQHDVAAYVAGDRSARWTFPSANPASQAVPHRQRCGTLQGGEPCDSYEDYGLGVRCIVHGGGFPDAMFPAVYNANMRIVQSPGTIAITYELIHDTRIIPSALRRSQILGAVTPDSKLSGYRARLVGGDDARRGNRRLESDDARSVVGLRLIERFTRTGRDSIQYRVAFIDPFSWTAPWTAALDLKRVRTTPVCSSTRAMRATTA